MSKIALALTLFVSLLVTNSSCTNKLSGRIKQGNISYSISYSNIKSESMMAKLLPREMQFTFRKGKSKTNFIGPVGTYNFCYISDTRQNVNSVLFNLSNNEYIYQEKLKDIPLGYNEIGKITVKISDEQKEIKGFKCKKGYILFADENIELECYITNEIVCKTPNICNLFNQVEGTLLEFGFIFKNPGKLQMKFELKSVEEVEIDETEFEISGEAEKVSRKAMLDLLSTSML